MLLSGVLLGIVLGLARGGRLRSLAQLDLRVLPLIIMAASARLIAPYVGGIGLYLETVALAAVVVWCVINRSQIGAVAVGFGAALNLAVVVMNGGMPVDVGALSSAGARMPTDPLHVELGASTRLPFLADLLPFGLFHSVYSVGDVLITLGGFLISYRALRATG
jgi:uncharacterized protein DUF5317